MTNNLEDIVQLVMRAYSDTHGDEYDITPMFELEVRKALMQKYCTNVPSPSYSVRLNPLVSNNTTSSALYTPTNSLLNG